MKSILVPVSNRPESKTALLAAAGLAIRVDANITACHLRPHREIDRDYSPAGVPLFGTPKNQWIEQLHKKSTIAAARETKKFFHDLVPGTGLKIVKRIPLGASGTAIWQEKAGSPDRLMSILGPVNDLTGIVPTLGQGRRRAYVRTVRAVAKQSPRAVFAPASVQSTRETCCNSLASGRRDRPPGHGRNADTANGGAGYDYSLRAGNPAWAKVIPPEKLPA